jgi:hypothetical protein
VRRVSKMDPHMSKRLPTVPERLRKALRTAFRRDPLSSAERKLDAIRAAARYSFPTADVEQMNSQIESGHLGKRGA